MNKCIRHGEVMLVPVDKLPRVKKQETVSYIVAHSESGHHHVLESQTKFEVFTKKDKEELYLRLFEPGKLVHRKTQDAHKTLPVPAGTWKVVHKTEYNPWEGVISRVFD